MSYNPSRQYRCTIIRGKSQSDMEDLLPLYAGIVDQLCPCREDFFRERAQNALSRALFRTADFAALSEANQKTVRNHLTEVAGVLLGLYYPLTDASSGVTYVYQSEACRHLLQANDYTLFFRNLCYNFQFPNGAKKSNYVAQDLAEGLHLRPMCYVVALLDHANRQNLASPLMMQEVGYFALNNLDVLRGEVNVEDVYGAIMSWRRQRKCVPRLSGSHDWQHIREQFNLLELADLVETDGECLWLTTTAKNIAALFAKQATTLGFNAAALPFGSLAERKRYFEVWKAYYGSWNETIGATAAKVSVKVVSKGDKSAQPLTTTKQIGQAGEELVYRLEQERIKAYKPRLCNKVLLLGATKGLGYDISSLEADESPEHPEYARYIEVKSTRRLTEPSFSNEWGDAVNLTAKEWKAAEQFGDYYNIYRVYFTKHRTFVVRLRNPFALNEAGLIEVFATSYQMSFGAAATTKVTIV